MVPSCADCKIDLQQINILDATAPSWGTTGRGQIMLHYAPVGAGQTLTGSAKEAVPITGMICPQCRRISLFG